MSKKIKVLLVEDDLDFAYLIEKVICSDERLDLIGHATNKTSAVNLACGLKPDIVVMDLNLSGADLDGIEASKEIGILTGSKVLLLTSLEQTDVIINASKKAFASGYIFKSHYETITDTIYNTAVSRTPQEEFIKELVLSDLSSAERAVFTDMLNEEINLTISSAGKTIANQKTSIYKKLGVRGSDELIRIFMR